MSSLDIFLSALGENRWAYTTEVKDVTVRNHQYLQRKWNTKVVPNVTVVSFRNGYDHHGTAYFTEGKWNTSVSPNMAVGGTRDMVWRGRNLSDVLDDIERYAPGRVAERRAQRAQEDAERQEKQRREDAHRRAQRHVLAEHADEVARLTEIFLSEEQS